MKKLFTFMLLLLGVVQSMYAQEPYAVLSDDNTTLTFYYDKNKVKNGGMDVGPFEYGYISSGVNSGTYGVTSGWYGQRDNITTVTFEILLPTIPTSPVRLFGFTNAQILQPLME